MYNMQHFLQGHYRNTTEFAFVSSIDLPRDFDTNFQDRHAN